jgi:hypothetical protein
LQTLLKIYERELIRIMRTLSYNLSNVNKSSAYQCTLFFAWVIKLLLALEVILAQLESNL